MPGLVTIDSLPNEVIDDVVALLPTRGLLPLTLVSRRIHGVTSDALKRRLLRTADLDSHEMMLECYHPSAKISTPSLTCCHTGMGFVGTREERARSEAKSREDWDLADLGRLYSRFRPSLSETRRHYRSNSGPVATPVPPKPAQAVFLDDAELFTQLCATTSIVRMGPRPGLFLSHNGIGDGVVRVWRDWLLRAAARSAPGGADEDDENVLWADSQRNVGVRFSVAGPAGPAGLMRHVLVSCDEEPPVEYTLYYEELLVRTNQVLLAIEQSAIREVAHTGFLVQVEGKLGLPVQTVTWSMPNYGDAALTRPVMGGL